MPTAPSTSSAPGSANFALFDRWHGDSAPGQVAGFYPLAIGNRWTYVRVFTDHLLAADGTPIAVADGRSTVTRVQVCPIDLGGRLYLNEQVTESWSGGSTTYYIRLRQDTRGLYETDETSVVAGCERDAAVPLAGTGLDRPRSEARRLARLDPARRTAFARAWQAHEERVTRVQSDAGLAASLPGFAGPAAFSGELLRLRYPLFPGSRWVIRRSPRFTAMVEAVETLDLPAGRFTGWRILTDSEYLGPNDWVRVWYGEKGFLKLAYHIESVATDADGHVTGTIVSDNSTTLDGLELAGR